MATSRSQRAEGAPESRDAQMSSREEASPDPRPTRGGKPGSRSRRPQLRLVGGRDVEARDRQRVSGRAAAQRRRGEQRASEEGTTTAEYTVVTGAAVAFGALLFTLLTSTWGNKILSTAFKHVIALLGS